MDLFELITTVADMNDKFIIRLNSVTGPSQFSGIDFYSDGAILSDDLGDYLHQYYSTLSKV